MKQPVIIYIILIIIYITALFVFLRPLEVKSEVCPTIETVKREIEVQSVWWGVETETALRIAACESQFKYNARNKSSTATGVYQWLIGSWKEEWGERLDYQDNIRAFMMNYKSHPSWWECQ